MKPDVLPHLRSLLLGDGLLASHAEIQVVDDAEAFSLSEELLDEAEGDAEPLGDVLAGGVVFVAGGQDAGAQIEGEGFHGAGFYHVPRPGRTPPRRRYAPPPCLRPGSLPNSRNVFS